MAIVDILILNQDWFKKEFCAAGHNAITCGTSAHLDFIIEAPVVHIDTVCKELLAGFSPDVIMVHDNSAPLVIEGLEETDIPVVFYSVDAHHHYELHTALVQIFDHNLAAQKDYIVELEKSGEQVEWMPLWASRRIEPSAEKEWGAVFVGTLDRKLNAERVDFFEALQSRVDMLCQSGAWWEIFPRSEIVINQTVKGDLNFRVFEVLMSGALLLTEHSGNGLSELFVDGQQLVCYEKNNVDHAAELISRYMNDVGRAREIAAAGRAEVLARHLPEHRAARLLDIFASTGKKRKLGKRFPWMVNCWALSKRLQKLDTGLSNKALISCLKSAEHGLQESEVLNQDYAFNVINAACRYDWIFQSTSGDRLIKGFAEAYKDLPIFQLAVIRSYLNAGDVASARSVAAELRPEQPESLFPESERVIQLLLSEDEDSIWEMRFPDPDKAV